MTHPIASHALPRIRELGADLLVVSRWELALSFLRPLSCFALYWIFAHRHLYVLAALAVAGVQFFTYTSTSHDLVHRTLRLPNALNDILLALLEALALRSGHAFRITHLHHHRRFPNDDDVEGAVAARGFVPALRTGPGHQVRLFVWAWRHSEARDRRWMLLEAIFVALYLAAAVAYFGRAPELALYATLIILSSWLYPLMTVWWPHRSTGDTVLTQTRCFRGTLIPILFFQHTYHLEHHLYPGVSSHRWKELARRLDPHLRLAGVHFIHLP